MPGLISWCSKTTSILLLTVGLCSCSPPKSNHKITIQVFQDWQLKPGDKIAGYAVTGGLGDISIDVQGQTIYAPFDGVAKTDKQGCLFYRSAEIPAYMFRLCGISGGGWIGQTLGQFRQLQLGPIKSGAVLGHAKTLQFATLRKQTNGKWAIVEPDKSFIESLLKPPQNHP
ncbi:hypothetical protein IQ266_15135 [filamentous cyanobacterium LEGE 11480]|uniref:Uncharacterized protein n=1 Tax=Romeriopsis navalis LEGE 11480 TaxID=2777977 RepID=A0A928Z4I7_9CYAN|nr:hypothetical protein [Romeriopsis navalis]MBE9031067.1 hypothetical protein [Romeriopsis navalis LEGE 11480]